MFHEGGYRTGKLDINYMRPKGDGMNPMDLLTDAGMGFLTMHLEYLFAQGMVEQKQQLYSSIHNAFRQQSNLYLYVGSNHHVMRSIPGWLYRLSCWEITKMDGYVTLDWSVHRSQLWMLAPVVAQLARPSETLFSKVFMKATVWRAGFLAIIMCFVFISCSGSNLYHVRTKSETKHFLLDGAPLCS